MNKKSLMKSFVNIVTSIRFLYTLFLPSLISNISDKAFIVTIFLLFATDYIDGALARKYKVQTIYGSVMDAIADKTLCVMLLILLVMKKDYFAFILIGELVIGSINIFANIFGKNTRSSKLGKIKMWIISLTIILGYMQLFSMLKSITLFVVITVLTQIITAIDYIFLAIKSEKNTNSSFKREINSFAELKYILFDTNYYFENVK